MSRKNLSFEGIFRLNEKGFGFVKIDELEDEIYINKTNAKGALDKDKVLIELVDINDIKSIKENFKDSSTSSHIEGKIVKILNHEIDTVVGTYTKNKSFGFVVPDNKKLGTDIFIPKKSMNKAKNNDKVVVKITKYPEKNKNAEGDIVGVIGNINVAGVDMLSLIKEYDLPYEFPLEVIEEAESVSVPIPEDVKEKRTDFRNEEIFTIDGEDAKDLDDAISVKKLENGNYELSVHIADVSYYVKEGSKLDKEAIIRGTSVYMLDRVIPMLPKELSNGICSLNEGEDRLTTSVIMEINEEGEVISSNITKGIINVAKRMNYNDVAINLGYKDGQDKYEKYSSHLKQMDELAKILKKRREKQGYLNLDIPETKIVLDDNGVAIDVKKYEYTFANEIIEQFMLTANEVIAERFYWLEAPFIYRVHEVPDEEKITELNKFLFNFGYKIKGKKDNVQPKAFAEVLEKIKDTPEERVISTLILRTLKVARYESENKGHFGIASKYYCHFTSPIRRYPDLFIHRMIGKYIKKNYNVDDNFKEKYLEQATRYADKSSEREKIAQKVERDSVDIKMAEYMSKKIGEEYEGIVSSVTSFGIFVELENTVEGLIRFEDLGNEYFIYDENRKMLIGEKTKVSYKIGDKVKIRVKNANKILRQIDFEICT